MMKVIIEVGSTNTKIDLFDGSKINHLGTETIEFKKNYKKENKLFESDIRKLIDIVLKYKSTYSDVYVCGTSIFRNLDKVQKDEFLTLFNKETNCSFNIISQDEENKLTVFGAVRNVNQKVAVIIGGGGSTEIAIYDNGIKEIVNSSFGVVDITNNFPDLVNDIPTSKLEDVRKFVRERLNIPIEKADILILAGGGHKLFALESGINYEKNTLFEDDSEPIMMSLESRKHDTERYYKEISLDEIRSRAENPKWWDGTRAMCAVVLELAETIGAKYIVPTDISMVYGIIEEIKWLNIFKIKSTHLLVGTFNFISFIVSIQ